MCLSSGSSEGSGSGSDEQGGGSDSDSEDINVDEQGRPAIGGSIDLSTRVFDGALPSGADPGPLIADCEAVFTARATGAGEGLSSGATFWVAANAKPKTALERLALQIFAHHAAGAEYDPSRSGAEWWTVVIDDTDDGLLLHPHLATVTYLACPAAAAPTLVLERPSPLLATETAPPPCGAPWGAEPLGKKLAKRLAAPASTSLTLREATLSRGAAVGPRLVNGYTNSVSPAKLINRMDDDDQSVDMDKLVFRPNPERLGLELSHSDDEE
ncbi:hypothetical protein EMIHUDRAFT_229943 [Emiliania huxleyi CCMP1516]|uniref:Sin1 middle CRIM domain-containing protein n=2 Tax=Emiliania huxleyi TaxID=2903 RepID=A0A0D3KC80_EMIH1|nr:hypothetical protein EMIHUDRAFT_229943 [Emiliania huxleyi CCMP1516]EOD33365.1 hypothetical protein EMIHUDRAFT_229943 [Emiliania huxleyi CCMP1516]|eukprot:XP_005785794.1 hypothetical protein EMIHUDRAFT_229943 [Emiliania huxleyi CCMP1516]